MHYNKYSLSYLVTKSVFYHVEIWAAVESQAIGAFNNDSDNGNDNGNGNGIDDNDHDHDDHDNNNINSNNNKLKE